MCYFFRWIDGPNKFDQRYLLIVGRATCCRGWRGHVIAVMGPGLGFAAATEARQALVEPTTAIAMMGPGLGPDAAATIA